MTLHRLGSAQCRFNDSLLTLPSTAWQADFSYQFLALRGAASQPPALLLFADATMEAFVANLLVDKITAGTVFGRKLCDGGSQPQVVDLGKSATCLGKVCASFSRIALGKSCRSAAKLKAGNNLDELAGA
jgi:hypothetical protein